MKAAFFDINGTLTTMRVWQGLMEYFTTHKVRLTTHIFFNLYHYSLYGLHKLGLVSQTNFRVSWALHMAWYLRGWSLARADEVWDWTVTNRLAGQWLPEVRAILGQHRAAGDIVMLVSGGPLPFVQRIAQEIGVEHAVGTEYVVRDGHYTGRAIDPPCLGANKALLAQKRLQELGLQVDFSASYAYADAISDLPLLEMVGNPFPVYPDDALRAVAVERGWKIFPENQ